MFLGVKKPQAKDTSINFALRLVDLVTTLVLTDVDAMLLKQFQQLTRAFIK